MINSWKRPKLKIPKTAGEWVWDVVGYLCYLGSVILLISIWSELPEKVPAHFNGLGEIDRWGSKWELFLLPIIGVFIIVLMQVLERFPESHNYPERLNESNAEQFYLQSRKIVNQIKNICLVLFAIILFESISIAIGWGSGGFGKWILPITLFGIGIPIVMGIMRMRKIK
ncbi:DUF1648 domain-containing protein [Bacillus sp. JJ1474]|uniref:DUF1648 domain-containing protein n=1 Tax=Bacillus sp. JJ1474 TaxID=3122955 RepID=UPI002FFE1913